MEPRFDFNYSRQTASAAIFGKNQRTQVSRSKDRLAIGVHPLSLGVHPPISYAYTPPNPVSAI